MATPEGWQSLTLGEVMTLEYGKALPEHQRTAGPFPVYGSNGRVGTHTVALVSGPGIVIGRKGTAGSVQYCSSEFWPIDTTYYVRTVRAELAWLQYALAHADLPSLIEATGIPGLNRNTAYARRFLLPPLPEQRKIAAILSAVDEVIEKTEAVIESLQALKKAMMQELLTRGLPGRHTRFKQTEIGEVPEGWEVRSIKDVVDSCDYGLSEKMSSDSMLTPILRMGNIQDGEVILDDLKYVDDALPSAAGLYLAPGDVLFNRTNSKDLVGKVGLFLGAEGPVTFASYLLRMKAMPGVAIGPWLAAVLNTERNQAALRALATPGVSQANINRTKLLAFLVPTPPIDEQVEIVNVLDSAARRLLLERAELVSANALKSALMSVLLTGELRVTPDQDAA